MTGTRHGSRTDELMRVPPMSNSAARNPTTRGYVTYLLNHSIVATQAFCACTGL